MDSEKASYGIENYRFATAQLAQTTMRSEIGKIELDRSFSERDAINDSIVRSVDEASDPWGIKVTRYEIKDITPSETVMIAMEQQVRAEREKRAEILSSEGVREARINSSKGDRQQSINLSQGERQKRINEAEGRGRATEIIAEATAEGLAEVAAAIQHPKGRTAVAMRIAQQFISNLGEIIRESETAVLPADLARLRAMVESIGLRPGGRLPHTATNRPPGTPKETFHESVLTAADRSGPDRRYRRGGAVSQYSHRPGQNGTGGGTAGKYATTLNAGFHLLVPFIDRVAYSHSQKEQAVDVPTQPCFTWDNVKVDVDGVLYYRVTDPKKASYGINDVRYATIQLAQTTMRSVIGKLELDKTFEERDTINASIVQEVDAASAEWGVDVTRYEIQNINVPADILQAMEAQLRAERDKRAQIARSLVKWRARSTTPLVKWRSRSTVPKGKKKSGLTRRREKPRRFGPSRRRPRHPWKNSPWRLRTPAVTRRWRSSSRNSTSVSCAVSRAPVPR